MDGNENFTSAAGVIAKRCRMCKLIDPFHHKLGTGKNNRSYLRGSNRIDFLLCTYNILTQVYQYEATGFNEVLTSDHRGFFLDLKRDSIFKKKEIVTSSPSNQKNLLKTHVQLKSTNIIYQNILLIKIERLFRLASASPLTIQKEKQFNKIDNTITHIILKQKTLSIVINNKNLGHLNFTMQCVPFQSGKQH